VNVDCVGCVGDGDADAAYRFDAAARERRRYTAQRCNMVALVQHALQLQHEAGGVIRTSSRPALNLLLLLRASA